MKGRAFFPGLPPPYGYHEELARTLADKAPARPLSVSAVLPRADREQQ